MLALLFTGAFYLSYAQSSWFFQDDFQLIMQYAHALQPQQLLDFGSFGRFLSRNAYWRESLPCRTFPTRRLSQWFNYFQTGAFLGVMNCGVSPRPSAKTFDAPRAFSITLGL
ncbi:hypothetical protein [Acidovorax radicis]|uniref:hypothetical protein n=1 Tax=Acidovorax radicis TaxID=758826 RepID=UPI001CF92916|nr:hypothetical protein [Acidovorax radicis]UCU98575.1 hypothetical protein KI609_19065 [Acidovorax radicis]